MVIDKGIFYLFLVVCDLSFEIWRRLFICLYMLEFEKIWFWVYFRLRIVKVEILLCVVILCRLLGFCDMKKNLYVRIWGVNFCLYYFCVVYELIFFFIYNNIILCFFI